MNDHEKIMENANTLLASARAIGQEGARATYDAGLREEALKDAKKYLALAEKAIGDVVALSSSQEEKERPTIIGAQADKANKAWVELGGANSKILDVEPKLALIKRNAQLLAGEVEGGGLAGILAISNAVQTQLEGLGGMCDGALAHNANMETQATTIGMSAAIIQGNTEEYVAHLQTP